MGAGSSAAEPGTAAAGETGPPARDAETPPELLQPEEDQGAGDAKLLHKNGQISSINGASEHSVGIGCQSENLNDQEAEADSTDVGQREPSTLSQKDEPTENQGNMPQEESGTVRDEHKDGQETIEEMPILEEKLEVEPNGDAESNEVGFKKVFKFVGFKFTVKKEKTDKSEPVQLLTVKQDEPVQLLTVKQDEVDANGKDKQEFKLDTAGEKLETASQPASLEVGKPNEEVVDLLDKADETLAKEDSVESPPEKMEENTDQFESKDEVGDKELRKSPESPTNPLVNETSSPLKKFFTQGWAGLRKKTSFKKPKEDELQISEKNEQENGKSESPLEAKGNTVKPSEDQTPEAGETSEQSVVSLDEKSDPSVVETEQTENVLAEIATKPSSEEAEESNFLMGEKAEKSSYENVKFPEECLVSLAENASFTPAEKSEHVVLTECSEETLKENEVETDVGSAEQVEHLIPEVKDSPGLSSEQLGDFVDVQSVKLKEELAKESTQTVEGDVEQSDELNPQDESMQKPSEGISSEAELLSSQEKTKLQGSPLRKLFTGSSLKKLSGKKRKVKQEEETKPEQMTDPLQSSAESPEATEAEKVDSTPSSPDEPVDASLLEKPISDETQVAENECDAATSDGERKKDGITPWASFKKLVTPKKRVKRLSESDKEDEPEKTGKSATMSSTDSANSENQEEPKKNEDEPKLEKSTEESKRKVDSSVSWEALICVGSSKKRARKTSDSDEEETQKPLEENPQPEDEAGKSKTETDAPLASSQEGDQAQESPSPEQAESPSEGEGVSTWASFKRLVTPRRKSKTRMEEKAEESTAVSNTENQTSDCEPGKEESWVSFKKLIPGRKKKKSDGKLEHAPLEEGQETAEDEDGDVPAVVPLSEYEAAEQEKCEAQQAMEAEAIRKETLAKTRAEDLLQTEEPSDGLVHAVTVTVVEGERAVTTLEERSPSWISATVTESIEQDEACKDLQQTKQVFETEVVVEPAVVKTFAFSPSESSSCTTANEVELTSEAVTALEETMDVLSCTEETTEMVSAVSQLCESQVTTEESTPVPEAENSEQSLEELKKQTQEILEEVSEKVRLVEVAKTVQSTTVIEVTTFSSPSNEASAKNEMEEVLVTTQSALLKRSLKKMDSDNTEIEQAAHIKSMQEDEVVCGKVSIETCFATHEFIQPEKSCVVHEDVQRDERTKDGRERENVEPEKVLEKPGSVLYSCVLGSAVSEPDVQVEELIDAQQQYQNISALEDIPALDNIVGSDYTDSGPAVDSESVDVILEERVLKVDQEADSLIVLKSTFTNTHEEFTGLTQEILECTEINLEGDEHILGEVEEILEPHEQLEENATVGDETREELLQTQQTRPGSEITQQESDMSKSESLCVDSGTENMQTLVGSEQSKEAVGDIETQLVVEKILLDHNQLDESEMKLKREQSEETEEEKNILGSERIDLCDGSSDHFNPVLEEMLPLQEEIVIPVIPEQASEGQAVSMPVTAAAVEEQVVAETVSLLETSAETLEPVATVAEDFAITCSDIPAAVCEAETKTDSVSQMAAATNAVFEAETSSIADSLDKSAQSDREEVPEHAENQAIPQALGQTIEIQKCEFMQSLSIHSQSSTLMQDVIQTEVQEIEKIEESAIDNFATEVHCEVDPDHSSIDECKVLETEHDCSDIENSEHIVNLEQINDSNTPEQIVVEKDILEGTVGHLEDERDSEVSKEGNIDSIAKELVEQFVPQLCEVNSQTFSSAQEVNHLKIEIDQSEHSHTDLESHMSVVVQEIIQTAVQELETEEKVANDAVSDVLQCLVENSQNTDVCVFEVQEMTSKGDASHTVNTESPSSTIVQTIIQTAVDEVERVEEVSPEAASVFQCLVQTVQIPEDVCQEAAETIPKEQKSFHTKIEQGEAGHTMNIESHSSTIVQTIIQTAVEVERIEEFTHNASSEEQCDAQTDRSPEAVIYEIQETARTDEVTAAPDQFQTNASQTPEYLCPLEVQGTAETEQVTDNTASELQYDLETIHSTKVVDVYDFQEKEEADLQSSKTSADQQQTKEPSLAEETVIENISETPVSEVCKEEATIAYIQREMALTALANPDQKSSEQLNEQESQGKSTRDNEDFYMTETRAKDLFLGNENEQQPKPSIETQMQDVESENPSCFGPVIETIALEALSQDCLESEQLKDTETEQTVKSKEQQMVQIVQVDRKEEVVPIQKEKTEAWSEETHGSGDAHHEQPQAKSMSEES